MDVGDEGQGEIPDVLQAEPLQAGRMAKLNVSLEGGNEASENAPESGTDSETEEERADRQVVEGRPELQLCTPAAQDWAESHQLLPDWED